MNSALRSFFKPTVLTLLLICSFSNYGFSDEPTNFLIERLSAKNAKSQRATLLELQGLDLESKRQLVPKLVSILKNPNENHNKRFYAAVGLTKLDETALVALIEILLQGRDYAARDIAAQMLGHFGPRAESAIPALVQALEDRSARVRLAAAHSLGQIGPPAFPVLLPLLKHQNPCVSCLAAQALRTMGDFNTSTSIPALEATLFDERENKPSPFNLARSTSVEEALPFGFSFEAANYCYVPLSAARTLLRFDPKNEPALKVMVQCLSHKDDRVRTVAATFFYLGGWASKEILEKFTPELIQALNDPNPLVRNRVFHVLKDIIKTPEALAATKNYDPNKLTLSLSESNPYVTLLIQFLNYIRLTGLVNFIIDISGY